MGKVSCRRGGGEKLIMTQLKPKSLGAVQGFFFLSSFFSVNYMYSVVAVTVLATKRLKKIVVKLTSKLFMRDRKP